MKLRLVVAVLVAVALASGVWAQGVASLTPRAAGMGGAAIGVADDGAAWFQNPAGLAALNVPCKEGSEYANDAILAYANANDESAWLLTWSGWKPSDRMGWGAGYATADDVGSSFGAGFGAGLKSIPLSAGINIMSVNPEGPDNDETVLNLGLMYGVDLGEEKAPLRLGLTVDDITTQFSDDAIWSAGLGWQATKDLLVAADVVDITEELGDVGFNGGVEYCFGNQREWRARAGLIDLGDEELTLGAGWQHNNWRADFAWINSDPDNTWTVGIGVNL